MYIQSYWYFQLCDLNSLHLCIWPDSEPTKLLENPKPRRGGGLRQINTRRKVPLQVNFLDDDTLHCLLWVLSFYGPNPGSGGEMKTTPTESFYKNELEKIWRNVDIRHSQKWFNPSTQSHEISGLYYDKIYWRARLDWPGCSTLEMALVWSSATICFRLF